MDVVPVGGSEEHSIQQLGISHNKDSGEHSIQQRGISHNQEYQFQDGNYKAARIGNCNKIIIITLVQELRRFIDTVYLFVSNIHCLALSSICFSISKRMYHDMVRSPVIGEQDIAIKIIDLTNDERRNRRLLEEAQILNKLTHPNIIKMIRSGIHEGDRGKFIYIAMELCHEQNLHDFIKEFEERRKELKIQDCMSHSRQICEGLLYLHEKKIVHGDLNPYNILFSRDSSQIKIADFGLSKIDNSYTSSIPQYVLNGWKPHDGKFSKYSDIYSLALTFYFMWSTGKHVFGSNPESWAHYISTGGTKYMDMTHLRSPEFDEGKIILEKMLSADPKDRPSAKEILRHDFFKDDFEDYTPASPRNLVVQEQPVSTTKTVMILFDSQSRELKSYDPETNSLRAITPCTPEMNRRHLSAVAIGQFVYVLQNKMAWKLNVGIRHSKWTKIQNLDENHGEFPPVAAFNGFIHVAGGESVSPLRTASKQTCSKYNHSTDLWEKLPKMNSKRAHHAFIACQGYLWCIGGKDGTKVLKNYERFDPNDGTKGSWELNKCPMDLHYAPAAAAHNEKIYVLGGSNGRNRVKIVYEFNTNRCQWTKLSTLLQVPRACFRACVINSVLYVVGGSTSSSMEKSKIIDTGATTPFQKIQHELIDNMHIKGEGTVCITFST
ncbi:uncharacterized protein LOC144419825 isoform X2 [Styela clava]